MEKLRKFETEEEFLNEKNSFNYPTVSLTDDNGKVWVMEEENYILATYLWDVTDENVEPNDAPMFENSLYVYHERPYFIEREELISINEEGHATFKLHLIEETNINPINLSQTSLWAYPNGYYVSCVPILSVDFSNAHMILESSLNWMFPQTTTSITFGDKFDTSKVTDMGNMFGNCFDLKVINFGKLFNTSNVTYMDGMFDHCESLTSLDVSNFDTSKVTNMNSMFGYCSGLTSLDLSSFDTSNVTNMNYMFSGSLNLTSLDLSPFDTSNVTTMWGMFLSCSNLTSLDLSSFNTSKVTNMNYMFNYCINLTSITFGNKADVSKVTSYNEMFYELPSNGILIYPCIYSDGWSKLFDYNKTLFPSTWDRQCV